MLSLHINVALLGLEITEAQGTLLTIFVGIIAVCVLGITLGLVGALIGALQAKKKAQARLELEWRKAQPTIASLRAKVEPIIESTGGIVADLKPKIRSVTDDFVELSHMVRAQATDLDSTISEVTSKARSQVDRVNGMVNSTLDTTTEVASNIERGIKVPFREVAGILAGVKAGFDVLTSKGAPRRPVGKAAMPRQVSREVEQAADRARAAAAERASEGRAAAVRMQHTEASGQRSVVEAGEETEAVVPLRGSDLTER